MSQWPRCSAWLPLSSERETVTLRWVQSSKSPARVTRFEAARANLQETLDLFMETASPEEIAERFHPEVYVTGLHVAFG